jgi:hypothetical protein
MVIYFLICIFTIIILLQLYKSLKTLEGKKPNLKKAVKKAASKTGDGIVKGATVTGAGIVKAAEVTGDGIVKAAEAVKDFAEDVFGMKQAKLLLCIFKKFPNDNWKNPYIGKNC